MTSVQRAQLMAGACRAARTLALAASVGGIVEDGRLNVKLSGPFAFGFGT